jgi:hypothetical protein
MKICGSAMHSRIARKPSAGIDAGVVHPAHRFVGAHVERADHHGSPAHAFGHRAIGFELLFFAGQIVAVEEQELAAEQADACGAFTQRLTHV